MVLGRALSSQRRGLELRRVSAAMVYEQALAFCAALVTLGLLFPFWEYRPGLTALSLLGIPVLLALLHPRVFVPLADRLLRLAGREPLGVEMRFGRVVALLCYYVAAWFVAGLACWSLARAVTDVGVDALPAVTVAFAFAFVVSMAAFVFPGGLGVREVVLAGALAGPLGCRRRARVGRAPAPVADRRGAGLRRPGHARRARGGRPRARRATRAARRDGVRATGRRTEPMGRKSRTKKEAAAGGETAARGRLLPVAELDADDYARLFRRCAWYVLAGAVAFAVVFALLAWLRYRAYYGGRFDLGNMVQAVYNTAHGRFLEITTAGPEPRQMSRLGAHVDPIIAVFALPWLVWPSPVMLLTLQSVIVATSAWPAYRLGSARHPRPARRRPARRRPAPLSGARLRGPERVPPRHARHAVPALRLPVHRRGPLAARPALPRRWRRSARRRSRSCSPSWGPTSPCASAPGGRSS